VEAFATEQGVRLCDLILIDGFRASRANEIGDRSMHDEGVMLKTLLGWAAKRRAWSSRRRAADRTARVLN